MQIGMIDLGRMGTSMVTRLMRGQHGCVVYDRQPQGITALAALGAIESRSLEDLVQQLDVPRAIWLMVPAAGVDELLSQLVPLLVKMVHNGIEYGLMATYAEGFNILRHANIGQDGGRSDSETTPLREPELYRYDLNLPEIAELWRRGSVIGSWLLDLSATALTADPALAAFVGRISDSGEGRWTIQAAIDEAVHVPVLSAALYARFGSRGEADFANRLQSAMRHEFGGHLEVTAVDGNARA